jgi:hypothetical protein
MIGRHVEQVRQFYDNGAVRKRRAGFPSADRLRGHLKRFREVFLRHIIFPAEMPEYIGECHDLLPFSDEVVFILPYLPRIYQRTDVQYLYTLRLVCTDFAFFPQFKVF